jgi:hypothetical protein
VSSIKVNSVKQNFSSVKAVILSEGKLPAYFTIVIIGFILAFHFLPTSKMIDVYYYAFALIPAFYALYVLRNRLDLRHPDVVLWGLLFFLCALSADSWQYARHIVYTAVFLLVVSRIIPGGIFRTSEVVRGFFWIKIIHVFISAIFYGWTGDYVIGGQLTLPLGKINCIYTSITISACLALVLPYWVTEKRWTELGTGFVLSILSIVYILQSRAGLAAMLVIFILVLGYAWHIRKFRLPVTGLALAAILVMCLAVWMTPGYISRLDSGRFEIWQKVLIDLEQCGYLFGCGTDFSSQQTFFGGLRFYHAHNIYLSFAFYNGLPAVFVFIGLCFYLLHKAWKNRDPWGGYLLAAMIGLNFDGGQVINNPSSPLWLAILLPMAMIANPKIIQSIQHEEFRR